MSEQSIPEPDRTQAPPVEEVERVNLIAPEAHTLSNGWPCYEIRAGDVDVVKVELLFHAGSYYQDQPLVAEATCDMMAEGTRSTSSRELSERIERYGVSLDTRSERDLAGLEIHALNRHLPEILPIVREMLTEPLFSADELNKYLAEEKHQYQEDRERVSFRCRQAFMQKLFGKGHPYGNVVSEAEDFDRIERSMLVDFHQKHYQPANGTIVVSGNTTAETIQTIDHWLGDLPYGQPVSGKRDDVKLQGAPEREHYIEKSDALQAAIRIGKPMFNKTHPDNSGFQVLNTLLGGYFGSRLMTNIREEKGYTYGIGSGLISGLHSGIFFITSEVGAQVKDAALAEIYKEIEGLRETPVSDAELDKVRNYMAGSLLRSADGPFGMAEMFKAVYFFGLDYDHFDRFLHTIHSITPEEVRDLARKHLDPDSLYEVVAGPGDEPAD